MKKQNLKIRPCCLSLLCLRIILLSFSGLFHTATAQTARDSITSYFEKQKGIMREKLYLHLDKPYYSAGESIWWKGYLIDTVTHTAHTASNFIYIELVNRSDSILIQKKFKRTENGFAGNIPLPADLQEGDYYVRSYTLWMLNEGNDLIYRRPIHIGNAIDRSVQSAIAYQKSDDGGCIATLTFTNESGKPIANTRVNCLVYEGKQTRQHRLRRTDEDGKIQLKLPHPNHETTDQKLTIKFLEADYVYSHTFYPPLPESENEEFAVSFFPEGGSLLAIENQKVAFKAQAKNGFSCPIQGFLLNEKGDTLSRLRTEYDGMGVMQFSPQAGMKYYALVQQAEGNYRRCALPAVEEKGVQIAVSRRRDAINYQIQKTASTPLPDTLYLMAHTRGNLCLFRTITSTAGFYGKINGEQLKEGITQILLTDKHGRTLSRRLLFIRHDDRPHIELPELHADYATRQKVEIPFKVTDSQGRPVTCTLSASITDENLVYPDTTADNILSNLLLCSDLKGFIENPGFYFSAGKAKAEYFGDLLMLTHGWSRFPTYRLTDLSPIPSCTYIEAGQTLSGRVRGFFGGKAKKAPIIAIAPAQKISSMAETDDKGRFVLENLNFKDTTVFVVQARSKRGFSSVTLEMDSLPVPVPTWKMPFPHTPDASRQDAYNKSMRDAYLHNGGMRLIRLNEVIVKGKRIRPVSDVEATYRSIADYSVKGEKVKEFGAVNAYDAVMHMPGVRVLDGDRLIFQGNHLPPILIIDGMRYDQENRILADININEVESIDLLKGGYLLGGASPGGAIVVTLKKGARIEATPSPGMVTYRALGYSDSGEFYHPVYDSPEKLKSRKTDIRSTVYWNSALKTDSTGTARITFYTPDNLVRPHIIIEGITEKGEIIRKEEEWRGP